MTIGSSLCISKRERKLSGTLSLARRGVIQRGRPKARVIECLLWLRPNIRLWKMPRFKGDYFCERPGLDCELSTS